jgi:hypothetical protein
MFEGMPVLIVKEWDLVTVELLEEFEREWKGKSLSARTTACFSQAIGGKNFAPSVHLCLPVV